MPTDGFRGRSRCLWPADSGEPDSNYHGLNALVMDTGKSTIPAPLCHSPFPDRICRLRRRNAKQEAPAAQQDCGSALPAITWDRHSLGGRDLRLDEAQSLEFKPIVRVLLREDRFHDASGHHDLACLEGCTARGEVRGEPGHRVEGVA